MGEQIEIIVTKGGQGGGNGVTPQYPVKPRGRNTNFMKEGEGLVAGFTKQEQAALTGLIISSARKTLMNSINNTADITGNYIKQTHINDAISLATTAAGLGVATYATIAAYGAGMISGVGAVVAIGGMIVNTGINISQEMKQYNINASKQNYQAERMRERAGGSLANGSRGTEN